MSAELSCSGYCHGRDHLNHIDGNWNTYHSHLSYIGCIFTGQGKGSGFYYKDKGEKGHNQYNKAVQQAGMQEITVQTKQFAMGCKRIIAWALLRKG